MKGATCADSFPNLYYRNFNPRPREGSDLSRWPSPTIVKFQSTPPWRERRDAKRQAGGAGNFNPRPREGSDGDVTLGSKGKTTEISIHAPVKGATYTSVSNPSKIKISIHAPVKGATLIQYRVFAATDISIHAPVKGATAVQV